MKTRHDGKMGGGPTSQYKHSTNFIVDDILGDMSSHFDEVGPTQGTTDVSWG